MRRCICTGGRRRLRCSLKRSETALSSWNAYCRTRLHIPHDLLGDLVRDHMPTRANGAEVEKLRLHGDRNEAKHQPADVSPKKEVHVVVAVRTRPVAEASMIRNARES